MKRIIGHRGRREYICGRRRKERRRKRVGSRMSRIERITRIKKKMYVTADTRRCTRIDEDKRENLTTKGAKAKKDDPRRHRKEREGRKTKGESTQETSNHQVTRTPRRIKIGRRFAGMLDIF
jgi:hypothetical protein